MRYRLNKKGEVVKSMAGSEAALQKGCVRWFDLQYSKLSPLMYHVPNGGTRNIREAAQFKLMGVRPGVADLILLYPGKLGHVLCIEFKTDTGRQSSDQYNWQVAAQDAGNGYFLCRSIEDFIRVVQEHLKESPIFHPTWKENKFF